MSYPIFSDEYFMNEALKEARKALEANEVPIGAVLVSDRQIIGRAHNMMQQLKDVTAHAEMLAITAGANYLGAKYLKDCSLYISLEPCLMCGAATRWAQLGRLVYAASDPREGYSRVKERVLHPKTEVISGILEKEASELLKEFFSKKRN